VTKKEAAGRAAQAVQAPAQDEHWGKGGSYVIDPETGVRTLVERTMDRDEAPRAGAAAADKE